MFSPYDDKMFNIFNRFENTTRSSILLFMPAVRQSWRGVPVTLMALKKPMLNGRISPNRKTL